MSMQWIRQALKASFNFLVGDWYLLIGALVALVAAAFAARVSALAAGPLLLLALAITLAVALRREITA
jgi:uncharacterized membrane protein